MHELSIARSVIDIVLEEMSKNGLTRVDAVTLRIGTMAQVLQDSLRFGFACLSTDTPLEGAKLVIEEIPAKGFCRSCRREFDIDGWVLSCPLCRGMGIDILSGRELEIVEIEGNSEQGI